MYITTHESRDSFLQKFARYTVIILLIFLISWIIKGISDGTFRSLESVRSYISGFGIFGPLMLILLQISQVVFPILPGAVGYAAGAVLFGWFGGFLCNYIGISAGSLLAFFLARKYGSSFVKRHVPASGYDKYIQWTDKKGFLWFLTAAIFLPVAPDDLLCFLAGLTKISAKKFCFIILAMKPWFLLLYSLFCAQMVQWDFLKGLLG